MGAIPVQLVSSGAAVPVQLVDSPASVTASMLGYAADAMVMVQRGATAALSGANLAAAYTAAKLLLPGGAALSATNRATVVSPPGTYTLPAVTGTTSQHQLLDAEFVDLVAQAGPGTVEITATNTISNRGPTIRQTAFDVRVSGIRFTSRGYLATNQYAVPVYEIQDTDIVGTTGSPTGSVAVGVANGDGQTLTIGANGFASVLVGDAVDLSGGNVVTRRPYLVITKTSNTVIEVRTSTPGKTDPIPTGANVSVHISRFNHLSQYVDLDFEQLLSTGAHAGLDPGWTGGEYGDVAFNGHGGGMWLRCHGTGWRDVVIEPFLFGYSWRMIKWCGMFATFVDCHAGCWSFVGDGVIYTPGGSVDPAVWAFDAGTYINCTAGTGSFGGCGKFASPAGPEAYYINCKAGNTSFSMGRRTRATYVNCEGGANCFGGRYRQMNELEEWVDEVPGQFAGRARNCHATGNSFGGGAEMAELAVWLADHVYAVGAMCIPVAGYTGYVYLCTAIAGDAKSHAATEPTWANVKAVSGTIVDDQVTWAKYWGPGIVGGTLENCEVTAMAGGPLVCHGAHVRNTVIQQTYTDADCLYITDSNSKLLGVHLIANGTGYSINAASALHVVATGWANTAPHTAVNDTALSMIVDADLAI